jgi:hypothetical protein
VHAGAAFVILRVNVYVGDSTLATFGAIFLVLLPALVYALLCTLWLVRVAQTALGFSR